jgi:hypothetical protein
MRTYRTFWRVMTIGCVMLGLVAALLSLPVLSILSVFVGAAVVAAATSAMLLAGKDATRTSSRDGRRILNLAVVAAAAVCALAGYCALIGAGGVSVGLLVVGSSPRAIARYRRVFAERGGEPAHHNAASVATAAAPDAAPETAAADATVDAGAEAVDVSPLSDAELCQAWRRSFTALQRAKAPASRMRVVLIRQAYLDEFERRNRRGLVAWLQSGARAASDPTRFLRSQDDGPDRGFRGPLPN